jgi:predicted Zn-dependent peptidase
MSVLQETLPSGLRFIAEEMPQMESVAIALSVDVGARHETQAQHGLSHLLEHMAFKGTRRHSAQQIAELFDRVGGQFNAFTSHEHTVYYARVLADAWPMACELLCEILQESLYDADELEREKGVILQELAMHQDTPDEVVFDAFQTVCFGVQHPLGRSILGSAEAIASHPRDALVAFVDQHYRAPRLCVSAAGKLSAQALRDKVAELITLPAQHQSTLEAARFVGGTQLQQKPLEQCQLVFGVPSLPIDDPQAEACNLLANMLGGGMSSRLFQEIREKRGLVYHIQAFQSAYAECGVMGVYAATSPDKAQELLQVICEELAKSAEVLTQEELDRARDQQIASLRMARESTSNLAEWMGRHMLHYGEYRSAAMLQQRLEAVSLEQVRGLAEKLLNGAPLLAFAALGDVKSLPNSEALCARLRELRAAILSL